VPAQSNIAIEIHSPTIFTVTLTGEHDVLSREAVSLALTVGRVYRFVLVDLTACTFLDSTMINALLAAAKGHAEQGGALELVVPTEANPVRRTLEIANVQMTLPFHETLATGLEDFTRRERPGIRPVRHVLRAVGDGTGSTRPRATAGLVVLRAQVENVSATTPEHRRAA
jgi:stage II sporulation protein AA (anti-sigma F factor antagonist)